MRQRKWGIAVGGASIRYRRRVPFLHRFELTTRLICHDGRWFHFLQEIHIRDRISASALMEVCATSGEGLVPAPEVIAALGRDDVWGDARLGDRVGRGRGAEAVAVGMMRRQRIASGGQ